MTPEERQRRFIEVSEQLAGMSKYKLLPNLVSEREGELLEELDRLEFEDGHAWFSERGRVGDDQD